MAVERTDQFEQAVDGTVIGDLARELAVALSTESVACDEAPQSADVEERELGEVEQQCPGAGVAQSRNSIAKLRARG